MPANKERINAESEQITYDMSIVIAKDQPFKPSEIFKVLQKRLGEANVSKEQILDYSVIVYSNGNTKTILLTKCITYLGNPHPVYKKRIQLPDKYQKICEYVQKNKIEYDVKFLGVYHYEENILFVDFIKDTYLYHGLNNSSAHVYINDLYQGMIYGLFRKEDRHGNTLFAMRGDVLKAYLDGNAYPLDSLFELFNKFNCGFSFGQWLNAYDIIKEMHDNEWPQWRQAEWAGWFLEYKFDKFVRDNKAGKHMRYIGNSNKGGHTFDFDIRFENEDFYGDLKASDIKKSMTPGNDKKSLVECIYRYDKFWYVIYEHDTIKDSADNDYEATRARNRYIKMIDSEYDKDELSYHKRMKKSVKFIKMSILELNRVNYSNALRDFNQGKQPDGKPRAPKFMINKSILNNDNFVVFRYHYQA